MLLFPDSNEPRLLSTLGARTPAVQMTGRGLLVTLDAVRGARIRCTVHSRKPVQSVTTSGGRSIPFEWSKETGLAPFDFTHSGEQIRVVF